MHSVLKFMSPRSVISNISAIKSKSVVRARTSVEAEFAHELVSIAGTAGRQGSFTRLDRSCRLMAAAHY